MTFPSSYRFGAPGQQLWSNTQAAGKKATKTGGPETSNPEESGDIQAWLQQAYAQMQAGKQQPDIAVQASDNNKGQIQGINSGMSVDDLQGRLLAGNGKTKGKGGTGASQADISEQIKKLTQSVQAKRQAASEAQSMGMPDQAIGHLKQAFAEVAGVQKALKEESGGSGGKEKAISGNSNALQTLQSMMNGITQQAAGIMQSTGVMLQPKDVENILMDGFNKKASSSGSKPGKQTAATNQSQMTQERLKEQAESLLSSSESNPQEAKRNMNAVKSIAALMQDFGNVNAIQTRLQKLEGVSQQQGTAQRNPFTKQV